MQKHKTCCFIGHRRIDIINALKREIIDYIENLVVSESVKNFLFGSRSDFDKLCHTIVTELKAKYPDIKRIGYTCRSETVVLETEREKTEALYKAVTGKKERFLAVEQEIEYKNKYTSGKGNFVERNQAMIDDSDYCVFYYNENYLPPQRKNGLGFYQPRSGTAVAFKYAKQKHKTIKNFYTE